MRRDIRSVASLLRFARGPSGRARGVVGIATAVGHDVRRNTLVFAACMALSWAVVQLLMTAGAPMLAELSGDARLAGAAPAISVAWWGIATFFIGRYMDAHGRARGIRIGFAAGAAGSLLVYAGAAERSLAAFLIGMALVGGGAGAVNLARAAAADMYPPDRRARGISFVLVGAAFGAILGPLAFAPLLARPGTELDVLALPWLVAAGVMTAGAVLTLVIRTDPLVIARASAAGVAGSPRRPLRHQLRAPTVRRAVAVAVASQSVMTTMMGVTALAMRGHGHRWTAVTITMSLHFLGMFGLVLVVGRVVDRIGRVTAALGGLIVVACGVGGFLAGVELRWMAPALFAIGLGWNLSFVAATAMLGDATAPEEHASVLGFSDLVSLAAAAVGSLVAGVVLRTFGVGVLAAIGIAIVLMPVAVMARTRPAEAAAARS